MKDTPSFHKNMYATSSRKYGTLLYFWMFPIAIVIVHATCAWSLVRYQFRSSVPPVGLRSQVFLQQLVLQIFWSMRQPFCSVALVISHYVWFWRCYISAQWLQRFFIFVIYAPIVFFSSTLYYMCMPCVLKRWWLDLKFYMLPLLSVELWLFCKRM